MLNVQFWIIFGLGILVSLCVAVVYGRRAIHPRLRPHFGLVVVVFLMMVLAAFFVAVVLGKLVGGGIEDIDPKKLRERANDAGRVPAERVDRLN